MDVLYALTSPPSRRPQPVGYTDGIPDVVKGTIGHFSQIRLQLGEDCLHRVEVRAVARKEQEPSAGRLNGSAHRGRYEESSGTI